MTFISGWIMSILGIVVLGTVVDLLMTKSRLKNIIRSVFATVSVLVIITPIPSIIDNGFDISFSDMIGGIELDESFLEYADKMKIDTLKNAIESALDNDGISGVKIELSARVETNEIIVERVIVDLSDSVIKDNLANINKYEFIKERVKSFTNNQEVEIIING
ncbi:MAG: hypothetical protein HFK09_01850 [Clostridia bacterium]|nr:hypothetical protein [Clostridia bacterium]